MKKGVSSHPSFHCRPLLILLENGPHPLHSSNDVFHNVKESLRNGLLGDTSTIVYVVASFSDELFLVERKDVTISRLACCMKYERTSATLT